MADASVMSSAEMFGTAKKFNHDLEQLPLHTHGAIVSLLNNAFQHRQVAMQHEEKLRQQSMQERQMALAESQLALQRERQQAADAEAIGLTIKQ